MAASDARPRRALWTTACASLVAFGLAAVVVPTPHVEDPAPALLALPAPNQALQVRIAELEQALARERLERARVGEEWLAEAERTLATLTHRTEARIEHRALKAIDQRWQVFEQLAEGRAISGELRWAEQLDALRAEIERIERRQDDHAISLALASEYDLVRFQEVQRRYESAIFLVHTRFHYLVKQPDGTKNLRTGQGFGTGFVVDDKGHFITNKHVVQPWKFDADLATMRALGEIEILEESTVVSAWPTGAVCTNDEREPKTEAAFQSSAGGALEFVRVAEDRWIERLTEFGQGDVRYRVHALDDHDLALFRLRADHHRPLPLAPRADPTPPAPLDPVLALGFPRGLRGLEGHHAVLSPSWGTVRKVEKTIQVTAPIIPGNSGGPLFDRRGRVIGVATRIYSETLGIALTVDHVHDLLAEAAAAEPSVLAPPPTIAPAVEPVVEVR